MDLYLIRHGESKQDTRENFKDNIPNHKVSLTSNGIIQCDEAGLILEEYLKKGFDDYLSKPIEKDELNRVLKEYLS